MVTTIGTPKKINAILLNIDQNWSLYVDTNWQQSAKFYGNILSRSQNNAKKF